ncbi:uncharacterized protein [Dysidea avara]|uniref:uncharacterized protein n=1 Tax=Dysidea avara TaxID=196820 RepID=UPI0033241CCA
MTKYCSNVISLSIPTTKLDPEQVGQVVQHLGCLQRLDIQWNFDIKQLLLPLTSSFKELTVRVQIMKSGDNYERESIDSWLQYWISDGFRPQNISIVTEHANDFFWTPLYDKLLETWTTSKFLPGCNGQIKFYTTTKASLHLFTVAPQFQFEFGESACLPHVNASQFGLLGLKNDLLVLTNCTRCGETVYMAKIDNYKTFFYEDQLVNSNIANLNFLTDFNLSYEISFSSEHLEQLAIMCPNLQRLNLCCVCYCLKSLQGLRAIASHCHSLQGLNLMDIPVTEVENHLQLWEILSDMQLTHLALDLCLFVSFVDKETLIHLYKKCTCLVALESSVPNCQQCWNIFTDNSVSLFSYFPMLTHCVFNVDRHCCGTGLQNMIVSCNELKCLYYFDRFGRLSLSLAHNSNLQQLYINAGRTDIPDNFMSSLSAHGGLVHVVLCVRSVTSEGITVLVVNSPKLMTFHVIIYQLLCDNIGTGVNVSEFESKIKKDFSYRPLFKLERCKIIQRDLATNIDQQYYEHSTDLLSLWQY